jgi:hypothetical protein
MHAFRSKSILEKSSIEEFVFASRALEISSNQIGDEHNCKPYWKDVTHEKRHANTFK